MSLISYFSSETLSEFLRRSNYWGKLNRNKYPIKIYRAISELCEWIDCPSKHICSAQIGTNLHMKTLPVVSDLTRKHFTMPSDYLFFASIHSLLMTTVVLGF